MLQNEFEFFDDNSSTGFRLEKLELLNWGTFSTGKVWSITPEGFNSLLTGNIGSGKSTIVDAITTLLVPHHKITFNKAAGSEKKERSIYSYIKGEYKSEKIENRNLSRSVFLRPDSNFHSVILGKFYNKGLEQPVTLTQVFWLKDDKPEKFFMISESDLSISSDFTKFGSDIYALKKRLKEDSKNMIFTSFTDYESRFRSIFGIKSNKALDLFYQTVSMKSVGNLTEFVRNQMLEQTDVKTDIENLKINFSNLKRAHESVIKAKVQLEKLYPLMETSNKYNVELKKTKNLKCYIEALPSYFAHLKGGLIGKEISDLNYKLNITESDLSGLQTELSDLRDEEKSISYQIDSNSQGQRLKELNNKKEILQKSKSQKLESFEKYSDFAAGIDLPPADNSEIFFKNREMAENLKNDLKLKVNSKRLENDNLKIEKNSLEKIKDDIDEELHSLRKRKSNIRTSNLQIREMIVKSLGLNEEDIPFAGELVKVRDTEKKWEGALERLLHSFGLSLLVSDELYKRVSNFVNKTNLKGRIVYFRVNDSKIKNSHIINTQSVINKLDIKSDSVFYNWLENELNSKYNYVCAENMDDFYHNPYSITKEGQIKAGASRHEKDDRKSINDRKTYILGWSNKEKIKALESEALKVESDIEKLNKNISGRDLEIEKLLEKEKISDFFLLFQDFTEINWQEDSKKINSITSEIEEIEKSSDELKVLKDKHQKVIIEIEETVLKERSLIEKFSRIKTNIENYQNTLDECDKIKSLLSNEEQHEYFSLLDNEIDNKNIVLENFSEMEYKARKKITDKHEKSLSKLSSHRDKMIKMMEGYKKDYPEETTEVDPSIEAMPEFENYYNKIKKDDLPKFEKKFNELLREKSIQDIAIFNHKLEQYASKIVGKIEHINKSLYDIEYNTGSYITLLTEETGDIDVRRFKEELKACMEGTFGVTKELYTEEKFNMVESLIERFNTELNWTRKVTDVRNWFNFTASERWLEDDKEKEFYSDSSGKSGGQKEKLAYTILASALSYQFGLEWNKTTSRSFRFVVIDEAFGKGSDDSTRYGLELFKKLDLQLLIVTPLQKINVIEQYIDRIHLVANETGQSSVVRNLTIEEYREEQKEYNDNAG